ncbi:MAG: HAD family hydrolase, partial [Vicinamibacteria bacterium]
SRTVRVGAFFDVDKTILSENSGTLYLRYLYRQGELTKIDLVKGIANYLQYKLNILDIERWTKETVKGLAGQEESRMIDFGRKFFDEMVRRTIYPDARRVIDDHFKKEHVVAIVSGATRYLVDPLCKELGIEHALLTRLEVDEGKFTGKVIDPINFGEGKVLGLREFVKRHRIDLAKSYFYTDSVSDLPLLDVVGHPRVVNPDPLLYRKAIGRRWPVTLFRTSVSL